VKICQICGAHAPDDSVACAACGEGSFGPVMAGDAAAGPSVEPSGRGRASRTRRTPASATEAANEPAGDT